MLFNMQNQITEKKCDRACQWLTTGWWYSPVSSTNKTDRHDIAKILMKVALNTITPNSK